MTDSFLDSSVVTLNDPSSFVNTDPATDEQGGFEQDKDPLMNSDLFTTNDENSEPGLYDESSSEVGSESPPRKIQKILVEQNGDESEENGSEQDGSEGSALVAGYDADSENTGGSSDDSDGSSAGYDVESSNVSCTLSSASEAAHMASDPSSDEYEPSKSVDSQNSSSSSSSNSSSSTSSEDDLEDYCGLYSDRYYNSVRRHRWY